MADSSDERPHEIVIIKRVSSGGHDEPHGGVWKVAFADFMTAMMAFFLVLWIVNSTSKETRVSVARYFNPVKLSDSTPARKGLKEPREEDFDATNEDPHEKPAPKPKDKSDTSAKHDARPEAKADIRPEQKPDAKQELNSDPKKEVKPERREEEKSSLEVKLSSGIYGRAGEPRLNTATIPEAKADVRLAAESASAYRDPFERKVKPPVPAVDAQREKTRAMDAVAREAKLLKASLSQGLGGEEIAKLGTALDVTSEADGILISLTDKSDFGMFSVGSAEPEPRLVRLLGVISQTLGSHDGAMILRGHTDARRYRGGAYDNWQLSTARAQAAYYVLVRSGIDEKRFERIEGYADHRLKTPGDPAAPENRRIEILIRRDGA